jgi:hypothetical protein
MAEKKKKTKRSEVGSGDRLIKKAKQVTVKTSRGLNLF